MKNKILSIISVIAFLMGISACHSPEEFNPTVERNIINNLTASFPDDDSDDNSFTSEIDYTNHVITVVFPYNYPKLSDNVLQLSDLKKMRVIADLDNNVYVYPTLLFMDMFDTIGTLVGVATKANMLDKDGKVPNIKKALFADAIGTTMGACLGTSTVSTFVESASGVAEGGRTGLTAVSTAFMFFLSLFLSPIFGVITSAVTASVLVIVGLFMIENIKELNLKDYTEAIPAFLTIIMMPFAYSISDGIVFGVVSYILLKLFTGRWKEISWTTVVVGIVFVLKFVFI